MRKLLVALSIIVALLPALVLAHGEDPPGALHIQAGTEKHGDVSTIDQPIVIDGVVYGDVTSISGEIIIRGVVTGDIVSWGGDIRLEPQAIVEGHVMALAGVVEREEAASIAGQVFNGNLERAGFASLIPGASQSDLPFGTKLSLALALLVIGTAIAGLLGHIWHSATDSASALMLLFFTRALSLGLLTALLAAVATALLLLLLAFTLVGVLALPLTLLIVHLPFLAGLAASGRGLERWLGIEHTHGVAGAALLLLPAFMVSLWEPLAGVVSFHLVAAPGLGALLLLRSAALRFHEA